MAVELEKRERLRSEDVPGLPSSIFHLVRVSSLSFCFFSSSAGMEPFQESIEEYFPSSLPVPQQKSNPKAKKMEGSQTIQQKKNLSWTPSMIQCLVDCMLEIVNNQGKRSDNGVKKNTYAVVAEEMNKKGFNVNKLHVENKLKAMKGQYHMAELTLKQSGFSFNHITKCVDAEDDVWDRWILAFKLIVADPDSILDSLTREVKEVGPDGQEVTKVVPALTEEAKDALVKIIRRMTPRPLKIHADVEIKCFQFDGVLHIKEAMRKAEAAGNNNCPVKIKLVAAPLYVLTTQTFDKEQGILVLNNAIKAATEAIDRHKGKLVVKRLPEL